MRRRALFLNLSLIFGIAYHVLFIAGYLLQKPLFGGLFCTPTVLEQIEPIYCFSIVVIAAVFGACFALFVLLMRKNASRNLFIGAAVFSGIAFITERIAYSAISGSVRLLNKMNMHGELGVIAYGLGRGSVDLLDMLLLPMFAAAIVLMCCAACVKEQPRMVVANAEK